MVLAGLLSSRENQFYNPKPQTRRQQRVNNLKGTAVDLEERGEKNMKHEKTKKCFHKPFNPIRNVGKLVLMRNKSRTSKANNTNESH